MSPILRPTRHSWHFSRHLIYLQMIRVHPFWSAWQSFKTVLYTFLGQHGTHGATQGGHLLHGTLTLTLTLNPKSVLHLSSILRSTRHSWRCSRRASSARNPSASPWREKSTASFSTRLARSPPTSSSRSEFSTRRRLATPLATGAG